MISHNYLLQNQYTYMYQRHLLFYYFFAKRHSSQVSAIQNAIYIYIYIWCEAFSYRVKHRKHLASAFVLEVFEFNTCDDFSVNIKFPQADQHLLCRITFFYLHFGLVFLELLGPHARFAFCFDMFCFVFVFFIMQIACGCELFFKTIIIKKNKCGNICKSMNTTVMFSNVTV